METTIAKYIADTLSAHGIEKIFTIPGSSCISMNNALNDKGILPILSGSEESATHAAHGYAAMTESFGCAVVSRGPAATNTITGLVTASEGYPVLVIVGDNASTVRQKNMATQDLPLEKIFDGVCDHATIADSTHAEDIVSDTLDKLVHQKKSYVLIVTSDMWDKTIQLKNARTQSEEQKIDPEPSHHASLQELPKTDKNILLMGSGILNNSALRTAAERIIRKYDVPFVVSTRGLGYPLPQRAGWVGIMAEPSTNSLLYEAEHIIVLDEPLETATTGAISYLQDGRKITNISLTHVGQYGFKPDYDIHIQPEEFAAFFESLVKQTKFIGKGISKDNTNTPQIEFILENILDQLPDEYSVCLDSGQNFFWGAHALVKTNKHRVVYSYTQATMGFGLPALVGVSSINPSGSLLICGDGGFLMASEELATMYSAGFKGKIIILNNNMLGMIHQTQKIKKLSKLAVDIRIHDLEKVVEGFGWDYISTDGSDEFAIQRFLTSKDNCVLNIQLNQNESVYPRGSTSERLPTV
jgi:acetolactate synthase-1/2/3 large subunit